ncbi:MAG TPA: aldolase/citrate lyase family protein [Bryobacterales bacterium]|jgi:4-hydroxy-2-oxoheptanedioate aldolase|nr:aldolase/citrate lyase family protein [Bryobacterales bacterium]
MKRARDPHAALGAVLVLILTAGSAAAQQPKHINKAIDLLSQGQPIYYTSGHGGYEEGVKMAQTWADYITYDMEHSPFDVAKLADFMRGLVKGGPTKSGHRTPAVIVTLPTDGTDEATMRANAWMVKQVLATGIHGILLCHADDPGAVRAFVESARFPFQHLGVNEGLGEGRRGAHGTASAARIWGISPKEYAQKADVWPLNPNGEIMLGLKIEDKRALANVDQSLKVPGLAFAEWGPGDMGYSLGFPENHDPPYPPEMIAARAKVLAACKANKLAFLNQVRPNDVIDMIREGVMIGASGPEAAEIGRKFTKRPQPW